MSRKFLTSLVLPADPAAAMEAATKQYVDSIVVISPTDPIATNPAAELWVDDDAPWSAPLPAGLPRGFVASVMLGTGDQNFTTVGWNDIVGATVSWTAEASRRYKTTVKVSVQKLTAAGDVYVGVADAAGTDQQIVITTCPAVGYFDTLSWSYVEPAGLTGTITRKLRVFPFTNGVRVVAAGGGYFLMLSVEDIGGT